MRRPAAAVSAGSGRSSPVPGGTTITGTRPPSVAKVMPGCEARPVKPNASRKRASVKAVVAPAEGMGEAVSSRNRAWPTR